MKQSIYIIILLYCSCVVNAQEKKMFNDTSKFERKTAYKAAAFTSIYFAGAMYVFNHTWYKDKAKVPFHFYNDNKGFLQVDKFGHMFGSYAYSYIGYSGLLKMGATKKEALTYGSTLGFILQLPIEIMDGIHEGYGFSWGDVAANALGSGLVMGQELLFNEQVMKCKFSYWESEYTKNSKMEKTEHTYSGLKELSVLKWKVFFKKCHQKVPSLQLSLPLYYP